MWVLWKRTSSRDTHTIEEQDTLAGIFVHVNAVRAAVFRVIHADCSEGRLSSPTEVHRTLSVWLCSSFIAQAVVHVAATGDVLAALRSFSAEDLSELFIVADVTVEPKPCSAKTDTEAPFLVSVSRSKHHKCPRCWRHASSAPGMLCVRCSDVLVQLGVQDVAEPPAAPLN